MEKIVKILISLSLALLIIVMIMLLVGRERFFPSPITDTENWKNFTISHENKYKIEFQYPSDFNLQYESNNNFSGYQSEFNSVGQVQYTDPISNQITTEPLIKLSITRSEILPNQSFSDWVNNHSATEDEQERLRKDVNGYFGIQQWIWHKRNPSKFSSINYYILVDNIVWQLGAWINYDNLESERFKEARGTIEKIFESVKVSKLDFNSTFSKDNILKYVSTDSNNRNIYESSSYNFTIALDNKFSYRLEPKRGNEIILITFMASNPNTNENTNRDTPNRFNTSLEDRLSFEIYDNKESIAADNLEKFKNWHNQNVPSRNLVSSEQIKVNNKPVIFTQEQDGIGSIGQYLYLFRENNLFVLGSADFPKQEILEVVESLDY